MNYLTTLEGLAALPACDQIDASVNHISTFVGSQVHLLGTLATPEWCVPGPFVVAVAQPIEESADHCRRFDRLRAADLFGYIDQLTGSTRFFHSAAGTQHMAMALS